MDARLALLAAPLLLAVAGDAPAAMIDAHVVAEHRADIGLATERIDLDEHTASPIPPGQTLTARLVGPRSETVAQADDTGVAGVVIRSILPAYRNDLNLRAEATASEHHTNRLVHRARARFGFVLPFVQLSGQAGNVDLGYEVEILVDGHSRWLHSGVLAYDRFGSQIFRWSGVDVGAPAPGPITGGVTLNGVLGVVELGEFDAGETFEVEVRRMVTVSAVQPGFIEVVYATIDDPTHVGLEPFSGEVTFTALEGGGASPAPAPLTAALALPGLAAAGRRRRALGPTRRGVRPTRGSRRG